MIGEWVAIELSSNLDEVKMGEETWASGDCVGLGEAKNKDDELGKLDKEKEWFGLVLPEDTSVGTRNG